MTSLSGRNAARRNYARRKTENTGSGGSAPNNKLNLDDLAKAGRTLPRLDDMELIRQLNHELNTRLEQKDAQLRSLSKQLANTRLSLMERMLPLTLDENNYYPECALCIAPMKLKQSIDERDVWHCRSCAGRVTVVRV